MGTIAVRFSYIGSSIYRRRTAVDRCAGLQGAQNNSPRGERAGEKTLDCAVRAFIIPIYLLSSPRTRSPVKCQLTTVNKTPTILYISFDSAGCLTCIGSLQTHIYKPDV